MAENDESTFDADKLNTILEFVRLRPDAPPKAVAMVANMSVRRVGRYLAEVKKTNEHFVGSKSIRQFLIFIATRYDPDPSHMKTLKAPYDGKGSYQQWVIDTIERRLVEHHKSYSTLSTIMADVRILFGADWDIMISLYARQFESVSAFVVEQIRTCPFVDSTHTAWAMQCPNRVQSELG